MEILQIIIRTILSYVVLIISLRIMGKREIGQLNLFDLIILLSLADIMIIGIENYDDNWLFVLIPVILLTFLQKLVSIILLKSKKIRNIVDGNPSIIIKDGKLCIKEMKKQFYNMDDLILQLRQMKVYNIEDVKYAILETSGKLSVILKEEKLNYCPIPLIISGQINNNTLEIIGKSKNWVYEYLGKNRLDIKDIYCAFYEGNELKFVQKSDK